MGLDLDRLHAVHNMTMHSDYLPRAVGYTTLQCSYVVGYCALGYDVAILSFSSQIPNIQSTLMALCEQQELALTSKRVSTLQINDSKVYFMPNETHAMGMQNTILIDMKYPINS